MKSSKKKTLNTKDKPFSLHGVLMDVYGVGVLLLGKSGVGKSETALDLIARGHRLVSDDLVLVNKNQSGDLIGSPPELSRHHMEVRGLGILNVKELYGAFAVRDQKKIDIALELIYYEDKDNVDRLGVKTSTHSILDTEIPLMKVPSWAGRSVSTIIEVAARTQLLRWIGVNSAVEFEERHREKLCER